MRGLRDEDGVRGLTEVLNQGSPGAGAVWMQRIEGGVSWMEMTEGGTECGWGRPKELTG